MNPRSLPPSLVKVIWFVACCAFTPIFVYLFFMAVSFWVRHGTAMTLSFIATCLYLVGYCYIARRFPERPGLRLRVLRISIAILVSGFAAYFVLAIWSRNPWLEVVWLTVAAGISSVAVIALRWLSPRIRSCATKKVSRISVSWRILALSIPAWWILSSAMDGQWLERDDPTDRVKFQALLPRRPTTAKRDVRRIGLSLSGGGYRAALFHAGVLFQLNDDGIFPTHISTVSGGSIIGSFYEAGGRPEDFLRLVQAGRFNLIRELLNAQNTFRLFWSEVSPWEEIGEGFSRLDVQAAIVDRLINYAKRSDNRLSPSHRPRQMICLTSSNGTMVGLASGLSIRRLLVPATDRIGAINRTEFEPLPIFSAYSYFDVESQARLTAASGAFPGALPPLTIVIDTEAVPGTERRPYRRNRFLIEHFIDGGIRDNLGLRMMLDARGHSRRLIERRRDYTQLATLIEDGPISELPKAFETLPSIGTEDFRKALKDFLANGDEERLLAFRESLDEIYADALAAGEGELSWDIDQVIVSDAGAVGGAQGNGILAQLSAAIEIAYANQISANSLSDPLAPDAVSLIVLAPRCIEGRVPLLEASLRSLQLARDPVAKHFPDMLTTPTVAFPIDDLDGSAATPLGMSPTPDAINESVLEGLIAFKSMSTLEDHPKPSDALAIFNLGRWTVLATSPAFDGRPTAAALRDQAADKERTEVEEQKEILAKLVERFRNRLSTIPTRRASTQPASPP